MAAGSYTNIAEAGYESVREVDDHRLGIMNEVSLVASGGQTNVNFSNAVMTLSGIGTSAQSIDITTGAGALVLDDVLQALSTVEQAAAQLVSAENRAQQQVNSLARSA
ncbi:MAG: hypothetical protein KDC92_17795 [Bacteroidetes bacterium]|nr:hypothetical protein [Bacteroidota bacterium]